jgi:hypothetical protein
VPADEVPPEAKRRRIDLSSVPPAPVAAHLAAAPAARPAAESKSATSSEMFMARLEMVAKKQQEYHAHLIRDGNQECLKNQNLVSENMPVDFFLLVNYWSKISIGKAGGTATCKGDSKGLSAYGSMLVYRSPSTAERAITSLKLGALTWSLSNWRQAREVFRYWRSISTSTATMPSK